ncbi:activator of 90 kDa heat shock protein ATPase homolog 1b [Acanthochromis polyacanthus]|uniref:Activator of 90 kDa heat shock protein ATPase homolog 1 n=1 Tax=Acanthochromis polyacanthus TaxID=80966 RepID=A0A3Q1GY11_9TELE|nr:activator of 90 kDa heat shock protein ATPase homolog 1b [Acanthochromis polyacanthus]
MAKWGEGDPRWIVEERADATNVNNWHWTERDATNWSSDKLKSLLLGLNVENEEGTCEVTEVSKVEGEASINNRKGKLIFFYEWNLKATWTGKSKAGVKYKGTIEVPNLSDENDMEDLDISVSLNKDEPDTPLTNLMKTKGAEKIREALGSYVGFLKTEFTQGMILPTANGVAKLQSSSQSKAKVDRTQISSSGGSSAPINAGVKIPTCKFSMRETFLTSPPELYRVFLNQEMVQAFTHGAATVDGERGGKFRLLEGNVFGEFTELIPDEKIVMKWRYNTWPCEHYATITLSFLDRSSETELKVECRGVPDSEEEQTREGWKRYYFGAIKQTFGFGARLF